MRKQQAKKATATAKLTVRQAEAAAMLSISVRWLRKLTAAGEIKCIRRGGAVLYRVETLEKWAAGQEEASP